MNIKHFIRERVLTFPVLILFFIDLAKKSLQVSLNDFCKISALLSVSKQAFSKARKKLSTKVFILLNIKLVEEFYTDNVYSTWSGYRLIAVDGSDIQLPQNEDMKKTFGAIINQSGSTLAMAKVSYAYDVLNHITLDAQIDRCKASERDLAVKHIEAIQQFRHDKIKDLYIYDRGYPSFWFLYYLTSQKQDFLIRCTTSSCFGKVKKAYDQGHEDLSVRLYANEAGDSQNKEIKERKLNFDRKTSYIDIRMIVVHLNTGEKELLITSLLNQDLFRKEVFKDLYAYRWGAEENYKWHKGAFELENFSGQSEQAVEQDFFSTVLTANMASLLIGEAQDELEEEHKTKSLKHTYKINKRIAIATMKDRLMKGLLDRKSDMEVLCNDLKAEIKMNLCPVRPGRKFKRAKKGRLKYGCTARRCI